MGRSLDIDEEVSLKDEVTFLVLLRRLLGYLVFPAECGTALDTVDISNGVLTSGHSAFTCFAFDNVYHFHEEICSSMLSIESPGHH